MEVKLTANSAAELNKKIDDYLNEYHPVGYGTFVRQVIEGDDNELTPYIALIYRAASCD